MVKKTMLGSDHLTHKVEWINQRLCQSHLNKAKILSISLIICENGWTCMGDIRLHHTFSIFMVTEI